MLWMMRRGLLSLWLVGVLVGCALPPISAAPRVEILWDTWGTPHIFARDETNLFRAFGWAQMQQHGPLLLRLYAQARGQGAAFFGPDALALDQTVHLLAIPTLGAQWYAEQPPAFRRHIDAFAAGINEYAAQHPAQITSMQALLPVTGADVFRHWARLVARFAVEASECRILLPGLASTTSTLPQTADGWGIAPAHTVAGHALLLANLQGAWNDDLTLTEVQLVSSALNLSGATFVGLPTLFVGFNDHLGWTHTRSPVDRCDLFALTPMGAPLTTITQTIQIAQAAGGLASTAYVIQRAGAGPVIEQNGQRLAVRVAGVTALPMTHLLRQWWAMGKARNWTAFQGALGQDSFFNLLYADDMGHLAAWAGGNVPQRAATTDWSLPVAGDQNASVWEQALPRSALPYVIDPPVGWVQSSGGTPWYITQPPLLHGDYPSYPAPTSLSAAPDFLREQWALKFLSQSAPLTLAELTQAATSTRSELADRILDDLLAATARADNTTAGPAAAALARWDRQATATSPGLPLFALWYQHWVAQTFMKLSAANPMLTGADQLMDSALFYAIPWTPDAPLTTPDGLFSPLVAVRALESAAKDLQRLKLPLDASWQAIATVTGNQQNWPGHRALGIFAALHFDPLTTGRADTSYLMAVEFAHPVRGLRLLRASKPAITPEPLQPFLRTRAAIEAHLAERTVLPVAGSN